MKANEIKVGDTVNAPVNLKGFEREAKLGPIEWIVRRENKSSFSVTHKGIAGISGWLNLYLCKKTGKIKR